MVEHTWSWSSSSKDSSRAIGASNRALGTSRNSQEVASSLPAPRGVWCMDQASSLSISPCTEGCRGEDCRQLREGEWCTCSGRYVWQQTFRWVFLHSTDACISRCKGCRFVCQYIYSVQLFMSVGVQHLDASIHLYNVHKSVYIGAESEELSATIFTVYRYLCQ